MLLMPNLMARFQAIGFKSVGDARCLRFSAYRIVVHADPGDVRCMAETAFKHYKSRESWTNLSELVSVEVYRVDNVEKKVVWVPWVEPLHPFFISFNSAGAFYLAQKCADPSSVIRINNRSLISRTVLMSLTSNIQWIDHHIGLLCDRAILQKLFLCFCLTLVLNDVCDKKFSLNCFLFACWHQSTGWHRGEHKRAEVLSTCDIQGRRTAADHVMTVMTVQFTVRFLSLYRIAFGDFASQFHFRTFVV